MTGLVFAGKTWLGERIRRSVASDYDRALEEHRDALARITDQISAVQSAANAALIEGQRVSAEWRAKAVDDLWREVLRIRNESPAALTMLDILLPEEHQQFVTDPRLRASVPELDEEYATFSDPEVEYVRPFLGEHLFALFFIYRAVNGRICFLLERDVKAGEVKPWFDDAGIQQLLRTILTEDEIRSLGKLRHGHVHWMRNLIEGKMLEHLRRVIAGEVSTEEGIEQARRVRDVVRNIEDEDDRRATS